MIAKSVEDLKIDKDRKQYLSNLIYNIKSLETVKYVVLFGSCARGDYNNNSDLDIAVITIYDDESMAIEDEIADKIYNLDGQGKDIETAIDLLVIPNGIYEATKNNKHTVTKQIEKEGVILWTTIN